MMKFICEQADGVLTDGQLQIDYQEINDLFSELENYLLAYSIRPQDGIVFECENSLPSALVLLFLLEKGYHFLLSKPENRDKPIPDFCRYQFQIQSDSLEVNQYLTIIPNNSHSVMISEHETAKLYLRTSGSTGEPKIIAHSHQNLQHNMRLCIERLGFTADHRFALTVPISHLFGLGVGFLPAIAVGASIDLQKSANILRFLQREKEFNPNIALMTPIFCETLLKGRKSARPYQLTVTAGDRLRSGVFERYEALFGSLVQVYGSTEMGAIAVGNPNDDSLLRSQKIGLPMPDVEIRVDPNTAELIDNQIDSGELWCRRRYGFENCIDIHGQKVHLDQEDKQGWFGTRDLGRISDQGYVEVLGRCDHSLKRDGLLVLFSEVESVLQAIEGIEAVAVVAKGESLRGKGLWAYCVINDNHPLTETEIRSLCFASLPRRAVPDKICLLPTLPLLANGKIDRQQLLRLD